MTNWMKIQTEPLAKIGVAKTSFTFRIQPINTLFLSTYKLKKKSDLKWGGLSIGVGCRLYRFYITCYLRFCSEEMKSIFRHRIFVQSSFAINRIRNNRTNACWFDLMTYVHTSDYYMWPIVSILHTLKSPTFTAQMWMYSSFVRFAKILFPLHNFIIFLHREKENVGLTMLGAQI